MAPPRRTGNRWSDKEWREAIRLTVAELDKETGTKKIRRLANVLVNAGLAGDMAALHEIGNRLDGRPAQDITVDAHHTHDLSTVSDAQLAAIITEAASGDGSAETPEDPERLH